MNRHIIHVDARRRRARRRALLDRLVGYALLILSVAIPGALATFLRIGW